MFWGRGFLNCLLVRAVLYSLPKRLLAHQHGALIESAKIAQMLCPKRCRSSTTSEALLAAVRLTYPRHPIRLIGARLCQWGNSSRSARRRHAPKGAAEGVFVHAIREAGGVVGYSKALDQIQFACPRDRCEACEQYRNLRISGLFWHTAL